MIAVELPVTEQPGELQGPEVLRISGLYELEGRPKHESKITRSFSWKRK
jgi:hypothetical protein